MNSNSNNFFLKNLPIKLTGKTENDFMVFQKISFIIGWLIVVAVGRSYSSQLL